MSDEQRSQREELIELLVYAPVGLLYEYRSVMPQLIKRGKSQVQLAKVFGQMAVQNRQQAARQKFDDRVESVGRPSCGATDGDLPDDPLDLLTLAVARGLTEFGATLGLAPRRSDHGAEAGDAAAASTGTEGAAPVSGAAAVDAPMTADKTVDAPLPIAGYDELPAREIISLLGDLDADQRTRIRAHESANRARKTVLAKLDRLEA